ncbi:MAG: hypothetical protein KBB95_04530 [Deltaproteobacteria bacterium]|nr:hypothetical protein [Deltaproteobacteria bacterium]
MLGVVADGSARRGSPFAVSWVLAALNLGLVLVVGFGWHLPSAWRAVKEGSPPTFIDICRAEDGWGVPGHTCLEGWMRHTDELTQEAPSGLPWGHASDGLLSICTTGDTPFVGWRALRFAGADQQFFTEDDVLPTADIYGITTVAELRRIAAEPVPDSSAFGLTPAGEAGCMVRRVGARSVRLCVKDGVIAVEQDGLAGDLVCDVAGCLCGMGNLLDSFTPAEAQEAHAELSEACVPRVPGLAECLAGTTSAAAAE